MTKEKKKNQREKENVEEMLKVHPREYSYLKIIHDIIYTKPNCYFF